MKALSAAAALLAISGCAAPIAAWKGRAYGEHSIEPNRLISMSSTFRNVRTALKTTGEPPVERLVMCFEPHSEVAALMGGTSSLTYSGTALSDVASVSLEKAHEASAQVQLAALHYSIACNAWLDGVLTLEEFNNRTNELLASINSAIVAKLGDIAKTPPEGSSTKTPDKTGEKKQ